MRAVLRCGLPVQYAGIKPGASVLDLGSGAGIDCFVVRYMVGDKGKVTGLDFSSEMITRARANNKKLGYSNVEFIMGDIENIPLSDESYHIVISNCVLNLVPDKVKAFAEIYRVLIKGGHFCISDVVITGDLPQTMRADAEMYAGCISGAMDKKKYLDVIKAAGFTNIQILIEKRIYLPETILLKYFPNDQLTAFQKTGNGIFSISLMAEK